MDALEFLDLVIGLIFIYLIFSIAASVIWEIYVNLTHLRGGMLFDWITYNFNETGLDKKIIRHPLIKGLYKEPRNILDIFSGLFKKDKDRYNKPEYISSVIFTDVLIDLVLHEDATTKNPGSVDLQVIKNSISASSLLDDGLKRVFQQIRLFRESNN